MKKKDKSLFQNSKKLQTKVKMNLESNRKIFATNIKIIFLVLIKIKRDTMRYQLNLNKIIINFTNELNLNINLNWKK